MADFNNLQQLWNQQESSMGKLKPPEELIRLADQNTRSIKAKHGWTIGILALTVLFLTLYFIAYTDYTINRFFAGVSLMILSLLLRVAIEYVSYRSLQKVDIRSDFRTYTRNVTQFYRARKIIHFIATPILFLTYIVGFTLLLPIFRQIFSSGFYLYIIVSGILFFIGLAWLLVKQITKETQLLGFLRNVKVDEYG